MVVLDALTVPKPMSVRGRILGGCGGFEKRVPGDLKPSQELLLGVHETCGNPPQVGAPQDNETKFYVAETHCFRA